MKKLNPTYAELLNAHLKPFKAEIDGYRTKGIVFVENGNVFLVQNSVEGDTPDNSNWKNYGYKYSWFYIYNTIKSSLVENLSIEIEEEWKPQFGELVEVSQESNNWFQRIFLFEKNNLYLCVHRAYEIDFNENKNYISCFWKHIRKIEEPKPIEISLDEAKKIIAESKNVSVEQINLNFKID